MLEASEPSELVDCIIENLTIIVNQQTGVKTLGCEHKVFFNTLFINNHVPNLNRQYQLSQILEMDGDIKNKQPSVDSLAFRQTTFRNSQILAQVANTKNKVNNEF